MPTWTKPVTLVPNTNENTNDLNAILDDIYARANGGLDETNVPNLAAAFTTYKGIGIERSVRISGGTSGAGLIGVAFGAPLASGTADTGTRAFYLSSTLFVANARASKVLFQGLMMVGGTAPGTGITVAIAPLTIGAAGAGASAIMTVGAAIASNTLGAPAANSATNFVVGEVNFPTSGLYGITIQPAVATAAGSIVDIVGQLMVRQV